MNADYLERLDPGRETGNLVKGLQPLTSRPAAAILKKFGVPAEVVGELRELIAGYERMGEDLERIARVLAPLGWIAFSSAPLDEYRAASILAEHGSTEEAERILVEAWNQDGHLQMYLSRVGTLYSGSEEENLIGAKRFALLLEALDAHERELYGPAIALVLAQIDGIVFDMTGEKASSFYATGKKAEHLRDQTTLAGHIDGLTVLADLFCKDNPRTQITGEMRRHGVLHGRELAFNTLANSTKAFVCLLAVLEWARPRANDLADRRREAYEQKWAGSDAVDEFGERRDNRGFAEAKIALFDLSNYEFGHYKRRGRYSDDLDELDPGGRLKLRDEMTVTVTQEGQEFFGSLETPKRLGVCHRRKAGRRHRLPVRRLGSPECGAER